MISLLVQTLNLNTKRKTPWQPTTVFKQIKHYNKNRIRDLPALVFVFPISRKSTFNGLSIDILFYLNGSQPLLLGPKVPSEHSLSAPPKNTYEWMNEWMNESFISPKYEYFCKWDLTCRQIHVTSFSNISYYISQK